jgi:subtilisin family serine protease
MRYIRHLLLVSCLVTPLLYAGNGKIEKKPLAIKNRYLVQLDDSFHPNAAAVAQELAGKHGGRILSVWKDAIRGFAIELPEQAAEALARDPRVLVVEEDQEINANTCGLEPQTSSRCADGKVPWQLDRIDQRALPLNNTYEHCIRALSSIGGGVRAYVIDSGIRQHSDFLDDNGNNRLVQGRNFTSTNLTDTDDCFGHGTAIASVLAGLTGGVAKGATLVPVRIGDCNGSASSTQRLIDAVNWVTADHTSGPAVANMSYSAAGGSTTLDNAANALVADGVVFTIAAGNNNTNACGISPQKATNVITVGATTKTDVRWSSSNYGTCVPIYAPGSGIGSAQFNSYCCLNCSPGWSGTSVAAPAVAGVAAIIYGELYWYTAAQIKAEILNNATTGVLSGIPSGSHNRLLFSANPNWCPWISCDGPPPES